MMNLLFMVGIMVIFFFFMIRPQMQRQKKEKQFREGLKKGDRIVTLAGIYGKVVEIDEHSALVEVDSNVKMRFERAAIREYQPQVKEKEAANA